MTYTVKADGYTTRAIMATSEIAARQNYARMAGWLSDMAGYWDFLDSLHVAAK